MSKFPFQELTRNIISPVTIKAKTGIVGELAKKHGITVAGGKYF